MKWFEPMPPARLALLRVAIGGFALYDLLRHFSYYRGLVRHSSLIFEPTAPFAWLSSPLPPMVFDIALIAGIIFGNLFCLGALYRLSGPIFAVLLLLIYSYRNSWGMIYHTQNLLVFDIVILGFCAAAKDWSVDHYLESRRQGKDPSELRTASWRFGWPVRLIWLVTGITYFLAGVAKVVNTGWQWTEGASLRAHILKDALYKELFDTGAPAAAWAIVDYPELMWPLAAGSLLLELGAPLLVMLRSTQVAWALAVFAMHWGIYFIMGIEFRFQLWGVAFLPFLPIEQGFERLRTRFFPTQGRNPAPPGEVPGA